jgi:cell wall-associated NlpC family hydrolase
VRTLLFAVVAVIAIPTVLTPIASASNTQFRIGPDPMAGLATAALTDFVTWRAVPIPTEVITAASVSAQVLAVPDRTAFEQTYRTYAQSRLELAQMVSDRVGVAAEDLDALWARTDQTRMTAVYTALAQIGTRYRRSGASPGGFDCSGLVSYSWSQAGVDLPRNSSGLIRAAEPRTVETLLPGDLVWRPGHVMMYLGMADAVVQSSQTGKPVMVSGWGRAKKFGSPVPASVPPSVPAVPTVAVTAPTGNLAA